MDVIDGEFSKELQPLDNFAATLACKMLISAQDAFNCIFDHSFSSGKEMGPFVSGVDKPMITFLISIFRDNIILNDL